MKKPTNKYLNLPHFVIMISLILALSVSLSLAVTNIKVRGGVIYPKTGDSTRTRYTIDRDVAEYLQPGMVIGVLPSNCTSASRGSVGQYYSCAHNVYLKPAFNGDEVVYQVIDRP